MLQPVKPTFSVHRPPGGAQPHSVATQRGSVPDGTLISAPGGEFPLSDERRANFAILRTAQGRIVMLVTQPAFGTQTMLELRHGLSAGGTVAVEIKQTTTDVIRQVYAPVAVQGIASQPVAQESPRIERRLIDLIAEAHNLKASDIHIETSGSDRAKIRLRVNGLLRTYHHLTKDVASALATALFSLTSKSRAEPELTWSHERLLDALVEITLSAQVRLQLRISSSPIYPAGNFHLAIRMASMDAAGGDMASLGYTTRHIAMLDVMISGATGMVLVVGPTNSGKSTTLQAILRRLRQQRGDSFKMITVEDPVEYVVPDACQISVSGSQSTLHDRQADRQSALAACLRGTLRQDPDVVMVGEIRDKDSAAVVKDLVLAGRKLFTTLHTSSALWSYIRLREIGIPWDILMMPQFISGIIYQRLVPVLCPNCSIAFADGGRDRLPTSVVYRVQQTADLTRDNVRVRGDGCERCGGSGLSGRTVCAEFILPDHILLNHLSKGDVLEAERYWRETHLLSGFGGVGDAGITALAHGIAKMRAGIVDPVDIEHNIALLTADSAIATGGATVGGLAMLTGPMDRGPFAP